MNECTVPVGDLVEPVCVCQSCYKNRSSTFFWLTNDNVVVVIVGTAAIDGRLALLSWVIIPPGILRVKSSTFVGWMVAYQQRQSTEE